MLTNTTAAAKNAAGQSGGVVAGQPTQEGATDVPAGTNAETAFYTSAQAQLQARATSATWMKS
jgi:hypothetical protein